MGGVISINDYFSAGFHFNSDEDDLTSKRRQKSKETTFFQKIYYKYAFMKICISIKKYYFFAPIQ